jgi:tRNA 2-selenouridine synthase
MAVSYCNIEAFIKLNRQGIPVIDSRSESEYDHAHFPGALNVPILKNDERASVGTLFRHQGRHEAVLKGFELAGPRFADMIREVRILAPEKEILLYCWRGGMRSSILAWVLSQSGFSVTLLRGGYKAFRNFVLATNEQEKPVLVLGGPTGSGKSAIMDELMARREQVLHLEKLASHKGSAFGNMGMPPQPSNEQFENEIAMLWSKFDFQKRVWVENESRSIGSCILPVAVYQSIRNGFLIHMQVSKAERIERILEEYGKFPVKDLAEATTKIRKRMGPQHADEAISLLQLGNRAGWLNLVLDYYDKLYAYGNTLREKDKILTVDVAGCTANARAEKILGASRQVPTLNFQVT